MAVIHPFRALRPPAAKVEQVASVPYDVVNTQEARALAGHNPLSFLHVTRPEIDLPDGTDVYSDQVYEKAGENFRQLIASCPLEREAGPSLYLYRLRMGEHVQTGVAACCSVDEYDDDLIRKHERTRPDKEDDRTRHMITLRAQTGVVFLTYRADRRIDALVEAETMAEPLYDFAAPDGVRHRLWRAGATEQLARAFKEVPLLYIADGHHRAASASRARAALREKNPQHTGEEEYNRFICVVFPDDQVQILSYNRVVKDLNGLSPEEFLSRVKKTFCVDDGGAAGQPERGQFGMYLGGRWHTLRLDEDMARGTQPDPADPTAMLDVNLLQDNLLDPVLGIKDQRTDKRIDFVGGIRGTKELEKIVDEGRAAVAFAIHATSVEDLLKVSDAGAVMPPKSTWFEPKLRDGLLVHEI
ncbi:MAG TPA: DUF1015 family protein [Pyrinomonadaceae bacterium]